jgi:hypothetical protein
MTRPTLVVNIVEEDGGFAVRSAWTDKKPGSTYVHVSEFNDFVYVDDGDYQLMIERAALGKFIESLQRLEKKLV